jgi:lipopolysaccharide export system permease protein
MKILSRYIARTFIKFWLLSLLALLMLVVVANLFGNLDDVFSGLEGLLKFLDDTLRTLPGVFDLLVPMATLLATLFTFNSLGRSSELVAMQSVGMGLFRQLRPVALVLVCVAALSYANQNYLFRLLQRADPAAAGPSFSNQWTVLRDQIIYTGRIFTGRGRITDVHIFQWGPEPFHLVRVQRAQRIDREGEGPWRLHGVVTRNLTAAGWTLERDGSLERPKEDFPDLLQRDAPDAHHMPFIELSALIRQLESLGLPVELYWLEWYQKTAALFAPFALAWFAAPLAQAHFRRGRASGEMMVGILGGLLFLLTSEILFTLGKGGFLAPLVAAWSVNIAFVALGCILMIRVR